MSATTTARYTIQKSAVSGWEIIDSTDGAVTSVAKNRDQARGIARELNESLVREEQAAAELVELPAEELAEVAALADAGDGFEWEDDEQVVASEADAEALARLAEQDAQDEEQARVEAELAVEPVTGDTVRNSPVFAALSPEAVEVIARNADEAAAGVEAPVAEVAEQGASVEDVIEVVRELNALTKLSHGALAKLVEEEPQVLLEAMDAVRTALASRTKVRLYASKLVAGQRISLRDAGTVTVVDVVKVAQRKVLVQWVDAAGVTGEREMGSWQWITLA